MTLKFDKISSKYLKIYLILWQSQGTLEITVS